MQADRNFLYTHNPFYLISCGLVLYGLQDLATRGGDLIAKTAAMTGGITAYTMLMIATCYAVVRWGKVWEDARSIFLVVLISLIALSSAFDELSLQSSSFATSFSVGGLLFALIGSELLIRSCRLRLSAWYRICFHLLMTVFFLAPMVLSRALQEHEIGLANAGALMFSFAIAAGLLVMIPAVRRGPNAANDNGTPWQWPFYPLTLFVVLGVLAAFRAHALWMSFGVYGGPVRFEPLLLMPIVAAGIVLVAETGLGRWRRSLTSLACLATPFLAVFAATNKGRSNLPLSQEFTEWFGSTWTLTLGVILLMFAYFTVRKIRWAILGVPAALLAISHTAPLPTLALDFGLRPWMLTGVAAVVIAVLAVRHLPKDWTATAVSAMACWIIASFGRGQSYEATAYLAAGVFGVVAMLWIGMVFETELALALRFLAAASMTLCVVGVIFRWLNHDESLLALSVVATMVLTSLLYAFLVERRGWFHVAGLQLTLALAAVLYSGYQNRAYAKINWPISSGMLCFVIGLGITTSKTSLYEDAKQRRSKRVRRRQFRPGI